ncbi:MAG: DUF6605 domain-containing protein [Candidatus Nanopelagicales bacterium]
MRRFVCLLLGAVLLASGCQPPDDAADADAAPADPAPAVVSPPETDVWAAVFAENARPGDPSWRDAVGRSTDPSAMSGYAGRSSALPGDRVPLMVTTTAPQFRVVAYRMGWYDGAGARRVWYSPLIPGAIQTEQGYLEDTRTPYAAWQPSAYVDTTGWHPGMYLLRLVGTNGAEWLIPLVLRSPDAVGRLVLVMADLTWQAYNDWGGRSAYRGPGGFEDRSRAVSFSRPYLNGRGTGKYLNYEHPVVMLAERLGVPVSYLAASDFSWGGDTLVAGAEGIVSLGHNEYWTAEQRDVVTRARDAGVDLAFLGANTMYWRARVEQGPQGMPLEVVYKSAAEDPVLGDQVTSRFRDGPTALPERELVGMDYDCFPASGTYTVTDPDFFLFAGTGSQLTFPDLVAVEVDHVSALPGTPETLQVVASNPTMCGPTATVSNSTYYTTDSGAGVFAVGTMGWVLRGLRGKAVPRSTRFARSVTERLLLEMMAGPMGARHPARPTLSQDASEPPSGASPG